MAEETKAEETKAEETKAEETKEGDKGTKIDTEQIGREAINKMLSDYGIEGTDGLKDIVDKLKVEEEKSLSDSEKKDRDIAGLTKKLAESEKARCMAESKLAAIKLGAKPNLVDDLVAVAMSRTSKDKNIDMIISEIKEGGTGSVYFGESEDIESTGTRKGVGTKKEKDNSTGGFAKRMAESVKRTDEKKRSFFS